MAVRGVFSLEAGAENGENVDDDEDIVKRYFYAVVTNWDSKKQYSEDGKDGWMEQSRFVDVGCGGAGLNWL